MGNRALSLPLNDDVLLILRQLMTCRSVDAAAPLLQSLHLALGTALWVALPPTHNGAPFPLTDRHRLHAWIERGKLSVPADPDPGGEVLRVGGRAFGVLYPADRSVGDDAMWRTLAHHLSMIFDSWHQGGMEQRASTEKETLVRLCRAANAHIDLQAVLSEAYQALHGSLPLDSFVATVYDPTTHNNVLSYSVAGEDEYVDNLVGPVPNNLQGYIVQHRQPLHFADLPSQIAGYPTVRVTHFGNDEPMRSWIGVPMVLGDGRVVGMLSIQHAQADVYDDHDLHFLQQVAVPVAIAVEKAMLLQQRDREISVLTAQTELSEALGHAHDLKTAIASAMTALQHSFPAHAYVLFVLDDTRRIAASLVREGQHVDENDGVGMPIAPGSLNDFILRQSGPVLFNTEQELIEAGISWDDVGDPDQPATESLIGAPLRVSDGTCIGVISVQSYNRNAFDPRHAALLASIGRQVTLVIDNARLIEQDQRRLRELELAYHELELAQHRVVEAERRRAIGDIAAGVAHDFNNLLGAILGNAQLIGLADTLPDAQEMAHTIEIAARDAATIVRRIQEFTRSRDAAEREPVDIAALLDSAIHMTRPRWRDEAQLRGITIELRNERTPVEQVLAVEAELREVLVNLILNAIDALPSGGTITVGCDTRDDAVHLWVRDSGIGMSPDVLARAGQPFFSTKGSRGSGLGLAVSQGVVQRHGGELVISSIEGGGTTVTLQLPTLRASAPPRSAAVEKAGRSTIVLVEDDAALRAATQRILEHAGHRVSAFASGPDAIAHLQRHAANLVITDLGLPGMSGWDVALAAKAARRSLRVMLVTGWGDRIAPEDAERCGVSAVLSKPLEQQMLLEAVGKAMRGTA